MRFRDISGSLLRFEPYLVANGVRQALEQATMFGEQTTVFGQSTTVFGQDTADGGHLRFDSREALGCHSFQLRNLTEKRGLILSHRRLGLKHRGLVLNHQSLALNQRRHGLFKALATV